MRTGRTLAKRIDEEGAITWINRELVPFLLEQRATANGSPGADVVDVTLLGAVGDDGRTDNYQAFSKAIGVANARRLMLYVPDAPNGGEYWFTSDVALPEITGPGYIGGPGVPSLKWTDRNGDCLAFRGTNKKIYNCSVSNKRTTALTDPSACIAIRNCAYGVFDRLTAFCGAANNSGVLLEQDYDAADADSVYLLQHIGCWYNTFRNVQVTYQSIGANLGHGLDFRVDPSAIGVGPLTGSCSYNFVTGMNVEGQERGLSLYLSDANTFEGGQFLGNLHQIYARTSSNNRLFGTKHNQWTIGGSAVNFDPSCQANAFLNPTFFMAIASPWQIGPDATIANTLGSAPTWVCGADGITWDGPIFRGGLRSNFDGRQFLHEDTATDLVLNADTYEFKTASGVGQAEIWLSQNGTLRLSQHVDGVNAGVLKVDDDTASTRGHLWLTGGKLYTPAGTGAAIQLGNSGHIAVGSWTQQNAAGKTLTVADGNQTTTTDATPTDIATATLPDNAAATIEWRIVARRTGGARGTGAVNDSASFYRTTTAVKNGTGATAATVIATGTPLTDAASADLVLAAINVAIATGATGLVKVQATGAAGLNLTWTTAVTVIAQT